MEISCWTQWLQPWAVLSNIVAYADLSLEVPKFSVCGRMLWNDAKFFNVSKWDVEHSAEAIMCLLIRVVWFLSSPAHLQCLSVLTSLKERTNEMGIVWKIYLKRRATQAYKYYLIEDEKLQKEILIKGTRFYN